MDAIDLGPPCVFRLVRSVRISVGGSVLAQVNWDTPIYVALGDEIQVEFEDNRGNHIDGRSPHPGAIVLGPDDYRLVEEPKLLEAKHDR